jgi:hypothetical protein
MNRDVLQKIIRIIKLLRTHDNDQEAEKFEMVSALEAELAKPDQPDLRKAVEMAVPLLIGYREYSGDHRIANRCGEVLEALRQALAQPEHPLDKKADNARELGLDYEPDAVQPKD